MPKLTFKKTDGKQTIVLADATDFQIIFGSCRVSVSDPGADPNYGFMRRADTAMADWHVGAGKTVYLQTSALATIFYEALA